MQEMSRERLFRFVCVVSLLVLAINGRHVRDDHAPNNPAHNVQDYPANQPVEDCNDYTLLSNTIPQGRANAPHKFLGVAETAQECVQLCCNDKEACPFAWHFQSKCYAVDCSSVTMETCDPVTVKFPTNYIIMHKADGDALEATPTRLNHIDTMTTDEATLTHINHIDTMTTDEATPTQQVMTVHTSTSLVPSLSMSRGLPHPSSSQSSSLSSSSVQVAIETVTPIATPPPTNNGGESHLLHKTISAAVDHSLKSVSLPDNSVMVFGSSWPSDPTYHYKWIKLSGPAAGELVKQDKVLELKNLVEGIYLFEFLVYDDSGNYGNTTVNITVLPEKRVNKPPVVEISPKNGTTYTLPVATVILDASGSSDDGGPDSLSYKWELVSGPLEALKGETWVKPLLKLNQPVEGSYKFKLTVTDKEGLSTVGVTNFTVVEEQDYPPVANAGSPVLLHLPTEEVTLSGGDSRDDKGIVKYEWSKVEGKAVDITGTNTAKLHLTHLEAGLYQFKLVVTDTSGQTASDTVTVDVQQEDNQPPIAHIKGGGRLVIHYPGTAAVLNGSSSYDDYRITSYQWSQIAGPADIRLNGLNKPVMRVGGLHIAAHSPTLYQFQLLVTDYKNLTDYTNCTVEYYKDEAVLPVVDSGEDIVVVLPERTAILNGSLSHDGFGISSYRWRRSGDSPAAGRVVGGSDHTPILMLTDLVNGTYNFSLTVTNSNGKSNTDYTILRVLRDPNEAYIVQMYLDEEINLFNQSDMERVKDKLVLKLGELRYKVHMQDILSHDQHILVEFYVTDDNGIKVNSTLIYSALVEDGQAFSLGKYHAVAVTEKVCHNPCSDRGYCHPRTKKCVCSMFWLENPFKANLGKKQSNCDWSLLYVIIIALVITCIFLVGVWLCCCCCVRRALTRRKANKKRKVKYAILDHKETEGNLEMLQRNIQGKKPSGLIVSESETEEEILFESSGKKSGKKSAEKQSLIPRNNSAPKTIRNDLRTDEIRNSKNT